MIDIQKLKFNWEIILAGLPFAGYWTAYLYEFGICTYFNIPREFIDVGIDSVLIALTKLFGFTILYFYIKLFLLKMGLMLPRIISNFVASLLLITFSLFAVSILNNFPFLRLLDAVWIPVTFVLFLLIVIIPMLKNRNIKYYLYRPKHKEADNDVDDGQAKSKQSSFFSMPMSKYASLVALWSALIMVAGATSAKFQTSFIVIQGDEELVVLKTYSDYFIGAKLLRESQRFQRKFSLIALNEELVNASYVYLGMLEPDLKLQELNDKLDE